MVVEVLRSILLGLAGFWRYLWIRVLEASALLVHSSLTGEIL